MSNVQNVRGDKEKPTLLLAACRVHVVQHTQLLFVGNTCLPCLTLLLSYVALAGAVTYGNNIDTDGVDV